MIPAQIYISGSPKNMDKAAERIKAYFFAVSVKLYRCNNSGGLTGLI
jgi:hypothetical protein